MSIFSRFRDIINSNFNSMLDNAEDPEKLIRLMIGEMEETLIEIKATCARVIADSKRTERVMDDMKSRCDFWDEKAEMAVNKGKDDLAREALVEKRSYSQKYENLVHEHGELEAIINNYHSDIQKLEDKLGKAREKQRILIQRHIQARKKMCVQKEIRKMDSSEAILKFDRFENHIERMEAEADLINYGSHGNLEDKFNNLVLDDEIEAELSMLKEKSM